MKIRNIRIIKKPESVTAKCKFCKNNATHIALLYFDGFDQPIPGLVCGRHKKETEKEIELLKRGGKYDYIPESELPEDTARDRGGLLRRTWGKLRERLTRIKRNGRSQNKI